MKYLLVVAHPDDEVLGAGASMWRWSHEGDMVDVAIMCTEAKARAFRPEDKELNNDLNASSDFLGIHKKYEATFPNIEMNTVPHLKLVQFIESAIVESEPDIIITHHPAPSTTLGDVRTAFLEMPDPTDADMDENAETREEKLYGFAWELVEGVWSNVKTLDSVIERFSQNWRVDRLGKIELTLLRLAVFEMLISVCNRVFRGSGNQQQDHERGRGRAGGL